MSPGTSTGRSPDDYPGAPGWVKTFAVVTVVAVVLLAVVLVGGSILGVHAPPTGGHVR